MLRESPGAYTAGNNTETPALSLKNSLPWNLSL